MKVSALLLVFTSAFGSSFMLTPIVAGTLRRAGILRLDYHKPEPRPWVPPLGGIPVFAAASIGTAAAYVCFPDYRLELTAHWLSVAIAFTIGVVDEFVVLKGKTKTLLTLLTLLPVVAAWMVGGGRIVLGKPFVPLLGSLRITIIYWLLLPLAIAGPANVVNMLDVMNGVMPSTTLLAFGATLAAAWILNSELGVIVSVIWLGALAGYLPYNTYPASIFNGDSASLAVGAALGSAAVLCRLEFIVLVALLPHLLNGFLVIKSAGLREHRAHKDRPIKVEPDGTLRANTSPLAPMSLTRLLLLFSGEAKEQDVVEAFIFLEFVAALLSVVSAVMVRLRIC